MEMFQQEQKASSARKFDAAANSGACACIEVQRDINCILVTERCSRLLPGRPVTDLEEQT